MKLFDTPFDAIEKKLDLNFKRHLILSGNVANSETPGFKARELDFAGELNRALGENHDAIKKTNPMHMDLSSAEGAHVVMDTAGAVGADGNNVDLDLMMGKLSANSRQYTNAANLLMIKLRILRQAAMGRGGI